MDILYWTRLNPDVRIKKVTKRYFNQYYYKLGLHTKCASLLRDPSRPLTTCIALLKHQRSLNYAGSWGRKFLQVPDISEINFLERLKILLPQFKDRIKYRIEDPWLQIYAQDETVLRDFAAELDPEFLHHIETVYMPESDQTLAVLQQGYTLRTKENQYAYKFVVKEGRYKREIKRQILAYLQNIGEQVQLPDHFVSNMKREYESVWNCYFYSQDKNLSTMLNMMCPTFIARIEEFYFMPR